MKFNSYMSNCECFPIYFWEIISFQWLKTSSRYSSGVELCTHHQHSHFVPTSPHNTQYKGQGTFI